MKINKKLYCPKCMNELQKEEKICPLCEYEFSTSRPVHMLKEGTLLREENMVFPENKRYKIGAVIGAGGSGITYAAFDLLTNQPVAIKEYFPKLEFKFCERDANQSNDVKITTSHESDYFYGLKRFMIEAETLGSLENVKNIVNIIDRFEENNTAYTVMKYIRGVNIGRYVIEKQIPPQKVISMMRGVINALAIVHKRGILHMDISPENILVQDDDTLVLIDFGAIAVKNLRVPQPLKSEYAPVEQYEEHGAIGAWTDIYALSVTLYILICGEFPPKSLDRQLKDNIISLQELKVSIKKFQSQAIMEGLAINHEDRIQSMEIFRAKLYNILTKEELRRKRRSRFYTALAAVLGVTLGILITLNFTYGLPLSNGLRFSLRKDGFHVTGFSYEHEKLIIPAEKFGIKISHIDKGAFQGIEILQTASIPSNVEEIGEFAFNGCKNLITVKLNEGVKKLSSQSFANCGKLQVVTVPNSLENISSDAFINSQNRLVLLGNLKTQAAIIAMELGLNYAHIETKLNETGITISKYETEQNSANIPDFIDGMPVTAIEADIENKSVFPSQVHSITFPSYLEKIGNYACLALRVNSIELPESLKHIGDLAFCMAQIESITLPENVTFVGKEAFAHCVILQNVKLSPNMKEIPEKCFEGDEALISVTIPEGINEIKDYAFHRCRNLSSLEIPYGVKIIRSAAFVYCTSLESLYLPTSLEHMNISALDGCPNSLTIIGYKNTLAQRICSQHGLRFYNLSNNDINIAVSPLAEIRVDKAIRERETITLPSYSAYSKAVPASTVFDARALKSKNVILPEHLQTIFHFAFMDNKYLESVDCPQTLK